MRGFLIGVVALAAGCAPAPEAIAPAYVSPVPYKALDCAEIGEEIARVDAALAQVSQKQRDASDADAIGVALTGFPVASMANDDIQGQVAQLKGEQRTVREVGAAKGCPAPTTAMAPTVIDRPVRSREEIAADTRMR